MVGGRHLEGAFWASCLLLGLPAARWSFNSARQHGMSSRSSTGPPAFVGIGHPKQGCSPAGAALVLHPVLIVELASALC